MEYASRHRERNMMSRAQRAWQKGYLDFYRAPVCLVSELRPVQVCVDHRCFLSDACARRVPTFPAACLAGHCPHCGSRLSDSPIRRPAQKEEGWLSWAALECGSLLHVTSPDHPAVQVGASARALQAAIDQVADGRLVVFAEQLGLGRGKVSEWRAGLVTPALPALLRLCYALNVRIVDFLGGGFRAVLRRRRTQRLAPRSDYRRWTPRVLDAALSGELTQPRPTLTAVERCLGCDRKTLRRHQPELCDQVVTAGREPRAAPETEKIGRLAAEVETAVQHLADVACFLQRDASQLCWLAPARCGIQKYGEPCEPQSSMWRLCNHNRAAPRFNHKRAKPAGIWFRPQRGSWQTSSNARCGRWDSNPHGPETRTF